MYMARTAVMMLCTLETQLHQHAGVLCHKPSSHSPPCCADMCMQPLVSMYIPVWSTKTTLWQLGAYHQLGSQSHLAPEPSSDSLAADMHLIVPHLQQTSYRVHHLTTDTAQLIGNTETPYCTLPR